MGDYLIVGVHSDGKFNSLILFVLKILGEIIVILYRFNEMPPQN